MLVGKHVERIYAVLDFSLYVGVGMTVMAQMGNIFGHILEL